MTDIQEKEILKETEPLLEKEKENEKNENVEKSTHTNGITSDGKKFVVPKTEDMMDTLFSFKKHSAFEYITIFVILFQIWLYYRTSLPRQFYLGLFMFWRLTYNIGIGYILKNQSKNKWVVRILKKYVFDHVQEKGKEHLEKPIIRFIRTQLIKRMDSDYDFYSVPVDFNCWLLFRCFVDLVLMNDFISYILFSFSYFNAPATYGLRAILQYALSVALLCFNMWVKIDAHRIVKDFAWYWGDFFFLIDSSLTFDGVFEMAPHPMYSVGYAGYYASALMGHSYWILFVSLLAHASQLLFLVFVENPHIEKIYGKSSIPKPSLPELEKLKVYFNKDAIGFISFDWFKSSDLFFLVISITTMLYTFSLDSSSKLPLNLCLIWKIIHCGCLGLVLYYQSTTNFWNKHFLKHGQTIKDGFQQWKNVYNLSMCIMYINFICCAWKLYSIPEDWSYGLVLFRHTFGLILIALHIWTACSEHEVLGDFGWFYGDFFIKELVSPNRIFYTGIYRFMNNPEKLFGQATFYGLALICNSWKLAFVALIGHILTILVIKLVEEPYMKKLYGEKVREIGGIEKVVRTEVNKVEKNVGNYLKTKIQQDAMVKNAFEKIENEIKIYVSELEKVIRVDKLKKFTERITEILKELPDDASFNQSRLIEKTKVIVDETTEKVVNKVSKVANSKTINQIKQKNKNNQNKENNIENEMEKELLLHKNLYRLDVSIEEKVVEVEEEEVRRKKERERENNRYGDESSDDDLYPSVELGHPITVKWRAPKKYITSLDWIGIYRVTQNRKRSVTTTNAKGCWSYILSNKDEEKAKSGLVKYTVVGKDEETQQEIVGGEICFERSNLPWKVGAYEFRYHFKNGYNVLAVSQNFEIIAKPYHIDLTNTDESACISEISTVLYNTIKYCINDKEKAEKLDVETDIMELMEWQKKIGTGGLKESAEKKKTCKRIVYSIKQIFGVDYSWTLIDFISSIQEMSTKIYSTHLVLAPEITTSYTSIESR